MFNHKFALNPLDAKFPGDSRREKDGAFAACHAEKQLGVFALQQSMAQALGVKEVTVENVAKLKDVVMAPGLDNLQTHFIVELEHKPCACCISVS